MLLYTEVLRLLFVSVFIEWRYKNKFHWKRRQINRMFKRLKLNEMITCQQKASVYFVMGYKKNITEI